jgi:hypothetical protein
MQHRISVYEPGYLDGQKFLGLRFCGGVYRGLSWVTSFIRPRALIVATVMKGQRFVFFLWSEILPRPQRQKFIKLSAAADHQ